MATSAAFAPSTAQRRLLDYIHEHPGYQPTRDLCRSTGIPRTSYYRWCRNPAFREWLGSAWGARLLFDGAALLNIARAQAPEKFSYWKALFEITFDPKGLGLLAKWAASLASLDSGAFRPAPDPHPSEPGTRVSPWPSEEEWNQRVQPQRGTLLHPPATAAVDPQPLRLAAVPELPQPGGGIPKGEPLPRPCPHSATGLPGNDLPARFPANNPVQLAKVLTRALTKIRLALNPGASVPARGARAAIRPAQLQQGEAAAVRPAPTFAPWARCGDKAAASHGA
ncbi:MAG: hypothetical protein ACRD1C_13320 [Terriglobales bacterium]